MLITRRLCLFLLLMSLLSPAWAGSNLRLLALGDSYTIGSDVKRKARWPYQLRRALAEQGVYMRLDYIAELGWNSGQLLAAIKDEAPEPALGLVTLQIGVNDQFQGLPINRFREHFKALLSEAVKLADGRKASVLVLSIPDYSVTPFGADPTQATRKAIAAFNQVARAETLAMDIVWIDLSQLVQQAATHPALIAGSGPHFSALMYQHWAELILPHALTALRGTEGHKDNATHAH